MSTPQVTLSGPDRVRLVLALSRAIVTPFTRDDWQGWSGADGEAHSVEFHQHDARYLLDQLGLRHVDPTCVFVVLDNSGITWNVWSPYNAYAWQVRVGLDVEVHDAPSADPDGEYWEVGYAGDAAKVRQLRDLPAHVRELVLACPEEAREHVIAGYLVRQTVVAQPRAQTVLRQESLWPAPPSELQHPWPGGVPA